MEAYSSRKMEVIALCPGPLFVFPSSRSMCGGFRRATQKRLGDSKAGEQHGELGESSRLKWFILLFLSFFDHLTSSLASDFHPGEGYHKTHYLTGLAATR